MVRILANVDESRSVVNNKDEEGWAPLHSAASIGNLEIVEILLSRGKEFLILSPSKEHMRFG